ncbi:hypothetical protein GCM10007981_00490 [Thermocladium modestius]|uniref:Damage-control phosphatase ARMT1-like metal-binding domain-containing protein n=1 Tax=Thermocladium modestius TaxID=62609 RepID=A0A830GT63_9CREN|nr:ARMT1-like domain-containing protein [Thermocladium modestius]GGP18916.1 hypothetical protein GCM10007981_00490 [Thermocladium modestius]
MWYLDRHECALCALSSRLMELRKFGDNEPAHITAIIRAVQENYGMGRSRLFAATFEEETKLLGSGDPYSKLKAEVEEAMERAIAEANPSLPQLIKMAAAANSVDAPMKDYAFDVRGMIERLGEEPLLLGVEPRDLEAVPRARSIAYVTDNAGEFAVDAALIRALSKSSRVTVISRSLPYETDVVASYVRGKVPGVEVLETGGRLPAFLSDGVREALVGSELVISKGVGNLEAYMESGMKLGNALFLLRVKCKPFVRLLGVPMGRPIIISSRKINELSF